METITLNLAALMDLKPIDLDEVKTLETTNCEEIVHHG